MKKELKFLIIGIVLIIILTTLTLVSSRSSKNIDEKIIQEFDSGKETIRVIVNIDNTKNQGIKGLFPTSSNEKTRDEIIGEIGEGKVRHKLSNNSFSAELTETEIQKMAKEQNIKIQKEPILKVFLQDSTQIINSSITNSLLQNSNNLTGKHKTVCVIDTGINYSHPDLGGCYGENNASANCKVLGGWDYVNDNSDPMDSDDGSGTAALGHGTHIAGIVAANGNIKGIAPESNLIAIKAMNSNNSGYLTDISSGIDWCVNNASRFNISVITLSLGTSTLYSNYCDNISEFSTTFTPAINNAVKNNISVTIASGNNGSKTSISSPACIKNATRVGSSTGSNSISSFSNRWVLDMLVAPGNSINSTYIDADGYEPSSGTSMSTPHVAGAIAIIKQYLSLTSQTKTPQEIEGILNKTGKRIDDSEGSGKNYSRIDVYSSIISLDNDLPNITLISPENETISTDVNQTFSCNATDLSLKNATLYVWNSSSEIYNISSETVSGSSYILEKNLTKMPYGEYKWNCLFYDENENSSWADENNSLAIDNEPPVINFSLIPRAIIFNKNISINFSAYDSISGKDSVWANITYPSGNVKILNSNQSFKTNETGRYNITFYANDTLGNLGNSSSYFVAYNSLNFNSSLNYSQSKNITLNIYFPNTNEIINSSEFSSQNINLLIPEYLYDIEYLIKNETSIRFYNINVSEQNNKTIILQNSSSTDYIKIISINTSFNFSNSTLKIYYNDSDFTNENYTGVYKCENWNFTSLYCNSSSEWINHTLNSSQDKIENYFSINTNSYSAFSLKQENYCGDGIINSGEECDTNNLSGQTCQTKGYDKGTLSCNNLCTFDTSGCSNNQISPSSGGGGGGGTSSETYTATSEKISSEKGYTQRLRKNDKIEFEMPTSSRSSGGFGSGGETSSSTSESDETNSKETSDSGKKHKLTIKDIGKNSVNITIESNPINLTLIKRQEKKLSLDTEGYYDFLIKLNSIEYSRANITIKKISKEIPGYFNKENHTKNTTKQEEATTDTENNKSQQNKIKEFLQGIISPSILNFFIWLLIILVLIFTIKEHKKIFPLIKEEIQELKEKIKS